MQHLRIVEALGLALLLLDGCAPRPIYRQPEATEDDAGADVTAGDDGPSGEPDAGPARDATMVDAPVAPDAPADVVQPDRSPAPDSDMGTPETGGEAPVARKALLIVAAPGALGADDAKLKMRLEAKGFTVTVGDDAGPDTLAEGMSLVVLSGGAASATLGTKYRATPVPLICLEAFAFGAMNMTGPTRDTDFGQVNGTQIAVVLGTHAIAAGHPAGNLPVATATTSLGWGVAAATAERIATLVGMANRNTAFAYEAGTMMVGMVAPARRVGLFATAPTPDRLNMAGWDIFDAAIDWATR
jgi:hypothetical protein